MYNVRSLNGYIRCNRVAMAALALAATLTACGGGSDGNSSSVTNSAATPSGASDASPSTPSTNASFFNSIFAQAGGSGYYAFGANYPGNNGVVTAHPAAVGRTSFYVTSDADTNFAMTSDAIAGPYVSNSDVGYITAEGLFMSSNPFGSDIGSNSKIFARLAQGYQLGMNGMSAPLYEITLNAEDVSGQTVGNVAGSDEAGANGLALLLGTDQTLMPAGAQVWRQTQKVLVSHVLFHTAFISNVYSTLEQAQAYTKGTIQTLGGYRYLTSNGTGTYVEYNGAIYRAELHSAGDVEDAMPSGYNRIAADVLAAEEKKAGL